MSKVPEVIPLLHKRRPNIRVQCDHDSERVKRGRRERREAVGWLAEK
jgi:hypothetical protein